MKKCIDCEKEVSGNDHKRCRKCNDVFRSGKNNSNFVHGMVGTRFYKKWEKIQERTTTPCGNGAKNYIGIKNLWKSFIEFKNDMYKSYLMHVEKFGEKHTTIDRIDFNGNYCKENCRWATLKEQARNKKNNKRIKYRKKIMCLAEWAEKKEINQKTLAHRINKAKWSIEKAFTTPVRFRSLTNNKKGV